MYRCFLNKSTVSAKDFAVRSILSSRSKIDVAATRRLSSLGKQWIPSKRMPKVPADSLSSAPFSSREKSTMASTAAYDQSVDAFPSIVIGPDRNILPQGSFAEAQAEVRAPEDIRCFLGSAKDIPLYGLLVPLFDVVNESKHFSPPFSISILIQML